LREVFVISYRIHEPLMLIFLLLYVNRQHKVKKIDLINFLKTLTDKSK
jgi:hypothetical protein